MERVTTRAELLERLRDLKAVETIARNAYMGDVAIFNAPKLIGTISKIKKDEDKHISLLAELIELLER